VSSTIIRALAEACKRAITAEPEITKFDIQMGDGDCGEAVESLCRSILSKMSDSSTITTSTPIFTVLEHLNDSGEDIGGSLGAILSILTTAFSNHLRAAYRKTSKVTLETVSQSVGPALENLCQYTSARAGDRTVMDALIPFCDVLGKTQDFSQAVVAAEKGADSTKGMKARFGRASYVGDERLESQTDAPPDPGAFAAATFLRGLLEGLS
jgi:triose/dihydroxyacetone kinase / FAD-AMP lyase (cyclizing)